MAGGTGALFCSGVPLRLIPGQAAWLVGLHNLPVIYSATSNHENQESGKRCGPVLSTLGVGGERVVRRAVIAVESGRSRSGGRSEPANGPAFALAHGIGWWYASGKPCSGAGLLFAGFLSGAARSSTVGPPVASRELCGSRLRSDCRKLRRGR